MVSKSFYPLGAVGAPADVKFEGWSSPPPNASMLAFGNLGSTGGNLTVEGWLYDVKNITSPQVLGKRYQDAATSDAARTIAHKFADEIIFRLGGGIAGIAESKIFFVSSRSGHREIWEMDYDGNNQHAITHVGSISLSPRISPDGSRLAFSSLTKSGWDILMYSMDLNRMVSFPRFGGTNLSPAWAPDGSKLAFSSSRTGDPEIYVVDASGANLKRMTAYKGPDVAPAWNRKTGAEIAWVSGPQRIAADLYHGSRRHQRAGAHERGLRGLARLAPEWTILGFFLDPALRAGGAGSRRSLLDGYCQQTVGAVEPRRRAQ